MKIFLIVAASALILAFILYKFNMGNFPTEFQKNALFIDVRTPEEFAGGSAPNAINIPLSKLEFNLDQFIAQEQVVVFCRSGGRSSRAKAILEKHGIQNVVNRSSRAKAILEKHGIQNVVNGGPWQNVANNVDK